jgi:hypothetical protein
MAGKARLPSLSSSQARYILEKLIDERKVSAADIQRHLAGMWQEMSFVEKRIAELRELTQPIKHPIRTVRAARKRVKAAAKRVVSAETKASRQIQGQYLGYMRQIPKTARAKYKVLAKKVGREQAIAAMRKALGK